MSAISIDEYTEFKEEFRKVTKRILKERLTTNRNIKYLIEAYNGVFIYVSKFYNSFDQRTKATFNEELDYFNKRLKLCFEKLNISLSVPAEIFTIVPVDSILRNYEDNINSDNENLRRRSIKSIVNYFPK